MHFCLTKYKIFLCKGELTPCNPPGGQHPGPPQTPHTSVTCAFLFFIHRPILHTTMTFVNFVHLTHLPKLISMSKSDKAEINVQR